MTDETDDEATTIEEELEEWEQRPGEGHRAYMAFCEYRALGPTRGLRQIARKVARDGATDTTQPGLATMTHIKKWSKAWDWVARAQAWDLEQERRRRRNADRKRARDSRTGLKVGQEARDAGRAALAALDLSKLNATDIAKLLDLGIKIIRLEHGEPDSIVQQQGPDRGPIRVQHEPPQSTEEMLANMRTLEGVAGLGIAPGTADKMGRVLGIAPLASPTPEPDDDEGRLGDDVDG